MNAQPKHAAHVINLPTVLTNLELTAAVATMVSKAMASFLVKVSYELRITKTSYNTFSILTIFKLMPYPD
jgi:hypothetical protein